MLVAARLRALRLRQGKTLDQIAGQAGIGKAHLSRLERGEKTASIATLTALAQALDVPVSGLFGDEAAEGEVLVSRATQRGAPRIGQFQPMSLGHYLKIYLLEPDSEFAEDTGSEHPGEEGLVVLKGQVEIQIADKVHSLSAGDNILYNASLPKRLRRVTEGARVLVMVAASESQSQTA